MTLLLKKRLFSSPARIRAHRRRLPDDAAVPRQGAALPSSDEVPQWLDGFIDDTATYDDEELADAEDDALDRVRPMQPDATGEEMELLRQMERVGAGARGTARREGTRS